MIGGQVGIAGHLTIGNNVRIQAQSGVGRNIKDDEILQGSPTFGYNDFSKSYVYFKKICQKLLQIRRIKETNNKTKKKGIMVKQKTIKTEIFSWSWITHW
jgi:UDP-3-O-[3-hydroxymyristoyl] glucosamine N-acyltransferase